MVKVSFASGMLGAEYTNSVSLLNSVLLISDELDLMFDSTSSLVEKESVSDCSNLVDTLAEEYFLPDDFLK